MIVEWLVLDRNLPHLHNLKYQVFIYLFLVLLRKLSTFCTLPEPILSELIPDILNLIKGELE